MTEKNDGIVQVSTSILGDKRNEGVELGRLIATVAVIIIHVPSFLSKYFDFAVPYFLALSGYFLARNLDPVSVHISALRNIAFKHWRLFLFWAIVYSVLPANWPQLILHGNVVSGLLETLSGSIDKFKINPINWLLDGPPGGFHLWYLANAPLAAVVVFVCLKLNLRWLLLPLAIASLAIISLLSPGQCEGSLQWATKAKIGFLIAIPSLIAGYEFSLRSTGRRQMLLGSILVFVGVLMKLFEWHPDGNCFSAGSIPIGVGMLVFFLSFPIMPGGNIWIALGRLTAGVYILHIAIRPIYFAVAPKILWFPNSLGFVILALLTFGVVGMLSNFRGVRKWLS